MALLSPKNMIDISVSNPARLTCQSVIRTVNAMQTRITEMLAAEFPVSAFSHCRDGAAAVSLAGGFGVLGADAHSPQRLETEPTWLEQETGDKPFGVDLHVCAGKGGSDVLVASLAGSARHARRHTESGFDLNATQGTGAGGHTGEVSTMAPVPEVLIADPHESIDQAAARRDSKAYDLANYFVGRGVGSMDKGQLTTRVVLDVVNEFIDAAGQLTGVVEQ